MIASQNRVYLWMGVAIALNWLAIVALHPPAGGNDVLRELCIALIFGSLFGHTTVAAAWAALGPGRLIWRVPLSLFWVALLATAMGLNMTIQGGPKAAVIVYGALLLLQWVLLQIPLWGLVIRQGMYLRHEESTHQGFDVRDRQFGLRQLILITAVIGVLFGIGRMIVPHLVDRFAIRNDLVTLIFLGIAEVILTLPLLLAVLLRRRTILAVSLALLVTGLATFWEHQLLVLVSGSAPGAGHRIFIAINAGTAVILLLLLTIVRLNGYSLATAQGKRRPARTPADNAHGPSTEGSQTAFGHVR